MLWLVGIAAAEPIEVERVLTATWAEADGVGVIARGKADGIVATDAPLRVYRIADGLLYELGQVQLAKVRRSSSTLTVVSGGPFLPGDRVEVPLQVVLPPTPQWGFELALRGLELVDGETELNRWRDWARRPDILDDAALCAELAPIVRERWTGTGGAARAGGRFSDRTVDEVMREITADEVCYALAWETLEPDPAGRREAWTLVHGWVAAGGPQGAAELLGRMEREDDAALAQTLRGALPVVEGWVEEVRWAAAIGDTLTEERLLRALERYSGVTTEADARWLLPAARAESARERGAPMVALPLYEEALAVAPERHRARLHGRIAVCHALVGNYEQAWPHFEAAGPRPGPLALELWGQALVSVGRYPEGLDKLYAALAAWEQVTGPPDEAKRVALVHLLIGETLVNQSRPEEGWPHLGLAHAWAVAHDDGDALLRAILSGAAVWMQRGDRATAAGWFEQAYGMAYERALRSEMAAFAALAGQLWWEAGERDRGMEWASESIRLLRGGDDPSSLAIALNGLADFELELGDVDAAVALFEEARAVVADDPRWTTVVDRRIARALSVAGREAEAGPYFDRAIATARDLRDPALLGGALVDRASNTADGDPWLAEAIEVFATAGRAEQEANAWRIRASEAAAKDDVELALQYANAGLRVAERSGNPYVLLELLQRRGRVHYIAADTENAIADYERALSLAVAWPYEVAAIEVQLARIAIAQGQPTQALPRLDRAEATGEADPDEVLELRSSALAALGRLDEAVALAQRRRELAVDEGRLYDEAYALVELAWLARFASDGPAAVSMMQRALAMAERMTTGSRAYPAVVRRLRADLADALVDAGDPHGALAELDRAAWPTALPTELAMWYRVRGRAQAALGDPSAHASFTTALGHARTARHVYAIDDTLLELAVLTCATEPDAARTWLAELVPTEDVHIAGRAEAVRACIAEGRAPAAPTVASAAPAAGAEDRLLELGRDVLDLPARLAVDRARLLALPAQLAPDEAVVVPVVLPGAVVVFVARHTGVSVVEVVSSEAAVDAAVADFRDALQSPGSSWPTRGVRVVASASVDPSAAARALHEVVIAPIQTHLEGATTLVFAPSGRLRYVPFAALYDGERFLVETYRIGLLTASGARAEHRPLSPDAQLLVVSNPDGTLPGATAEGKALYRTWGRRRTFVRDGTAATEPELLARLDELQNAPNVLHLATHGILRSDAPRDSYLVLADEGRLTLREITLLPLRQTELVVLSACETAVGESGGGEEIRGLAYQFEVRGAAAIVASLWAVDDSSTSEMMMALYGGIREGHGRAEALRDAQLTLLADPAWRHPYFWAPFILVGEWR